MEQRAHDHERRSATPQQPTAGLSLALRAAVACARDGSRLTPGETRYLFLQVSRFSRQRRDDGANAEAVIVELKTLLAATGDRAPLDAEVQRLRERVVRWAIEAYYVNAGPRLAEGD